MLGERLGAQREHVDLDDVGEVHQRPQALVEDEVVEGDAVALAREPAHRRDHLLVHLDVLEHLQHDALARQAELGEGREEGTGEIDEGEAVAHQALEADLEEGVDEHLRGGPVAIDLAGAVALAAAIEELVADHPQLAVVDGLPPDEDVGRERGGGQWSLGHARGSGARCSRHHTAPGAGGTGPGVRGPCRPTGVGGRRPGHGL